ncbi:MAG: hypothetical protein DI630_13430 [Gordonia sp. (in: high G+C Gram-positive bacteria)]|nr:MAG: hypothetical protein DI630_13430 [Gordonia sp. (in: high G+C Gram-positive bacteria)]
MTAAPAVDTDRQLTVYVVTFPPADDQGGVGGFRWDRSLAAMEAVYEDEFRHSAAESNPRLVRLVPMKVVNGENCQITDELENRSDELESTRPAMRQFVPWNTIPEHVPTGGLVRRDPHTAARTAPIGYAVIDEQVGVIKRGWFPNPAGLLENVRQVGNRESVEGRVATVSEHRVRLSDAPDELSDFEAACDDCDDLPGGPWRDDLLVWWDGESGTVVGDPAVLAAELVNALEPQFDGLTLTIAGVQHVF